MSRSYREKKVYIGNLNEDVSKTEVETIFLKYGKLKSTWIARKPPGFAFVEFEDSRDAEDAVRALDGTKIAGVRVRVEISHGKQINKPRREKRDRRRSSYRESRNRRRRYRSRSRSSRSKSRSYSRSRSRSRQRRYSRSGSRSRSRSRSRSKSR